MRKYAHKTSARNMQKRRKREGEEKHVYIYMYKNTMLHKFYIYEST